MALINLEIPQRKFELIGGRIADILQDEIDNQFTNYYDDDINAKVHRERMMPFHHSEIPAYNVILAAGNFDNKHQGSKNGTYQYYIDAYANSKSSEDADGSLLAGIKLQRLVGIADYIFEDPQYRMLGFEPGFINRVFFSDFKIAEGIKDDSMNSAMARMTLNVVCNENNTLLESTIMRGYQTRVLIGDTDKGYLWQGGVLARVAEDGILRLMQSGKIRLTENINN